MDERRETIVDFFKKETKISVEEPPIDLSRQVTIRKDLDSLEKRGLISEVMERHLFAAEPI